MPVTNTIDAATPLPESVPLPYSIYALRERASGRYYVGLTTRNLSKRVSAHLSQAGRNRPVRAGGLMPALQRMVAAGETFKEAWDAQVVGRAASADEARAMERRWITALSAAAPDGGFNLMPGGCSVGGPDNAVPLTIDLPDGWRRLYNSIQDAVAGCNKHRFEAGLPAILPGTAYARLSMGWFPTEALGYTPHVDGRGARAPVTVHGETFGTLRSVAASTGLSIATLRSRLHRRTQSRSKADLGTDMRRTEAGHKPMRSAPFGLRLPGTTALLTVREYAKRTDTPASTILHRWQAACRAGLNPALMAPAALLKQLITATDRRRLITLHLPDGRCWTGGERELARRVLGDPGLASSRAVPLSESGIRRRLRLLSGPDRQDPGKISAAFGFSLSCGEI